MAILGDVAILSGLASARPTDNATDTKGRLYLATDTGIVARDNGTGWDEYATLLKLGTTATTAAAGNDSRLSDARTPTAHKASHATGGADALAPADIGAATTAALTAHTGSTSNPHAVTAAQSGAEPTLGNPATDGYVLSSTAAGVRSWVAETGGGMTNPMTTQDDLIIGGASGAPARLGKGTDGQVLTVDPTTHHLVWATPSGGGGALTVDETDGTPSVASVTRLTLPAGTLTDNGGGHVTYAPATSGGGAAAYLAAVLVDAPVRLWGLQETSGTTAADASTNAAAATYNGTYLLGDGNGPIPGSKAARFGGTNSEITQASAAATNITGDLTLECWVFLASATTFSFLIGKGGGSGATPYALYVDNSGVISFQAISSGGASQIMLATFKMLPNVWQYFAVTRSGTTVTFYLNGTLVNTVTQTVTPATNTTTVSLGSRTDHYTYFGGLMAYAAIYDAALSATRIAAHYSAGRG